MNLFSEYRSRIVQAVDELCSSGVLPNDLDTSRVSVEPPREAEHGDLATNAAMVLAKQAGLKPRDLAEHIAEKLRADAQVTGVEIAGPGFINIRLESVAWRAVLAEVLAQGEVYSDRWHNDSGPTSMLAIFVLLNDVDSDGGPTSAINIPATKDIIRSGYASRKEAGQMTADIEANPHRVEMTGPAGTIMFVNVARCLHRAGIPAEGRHREWLQFRLFPSREATDTSRLRSAKILEYTNRIDQDY